MCWNIAQSNVKSTNSCPFDVPSVLPADEDYNRINWHRLLKDALPGINKMHFYKDVTITVTFTIQPWQVAFQK
jgi:hypothetical protein